MISFDSIKHLYPKVVNYFSTQRVVYHHVPKCGGTSISRALRLKNIFSQVTLSPGCTYETIRKLEPSLSGEEYLIKQRVFREQLLIYYLYSDIRSINGHFRFSKVAFDNFHNSYKFITVLREPVSRYISNYFYNYGQQTHSGTELNMKEYMTSVEGRSQAHIYVEYFSGTSADADFTTRDALENAKNNLSKFDLIGFTHLMPKLETDLADLLKLKLKIGHVNKSKVAKGKSEKIISPELKNQIKELCSLDIELYNYALKLHPD